MKPRLLDLLVCPIDGTSLELIEWESTSAPLSAATLERARRRGFDPELLARDISTGVLVNRARRIFYPIHNGIPRLTVFATGLTRRFLDQNCDRLAGELPGFQLAAQPAMPGEENVLRTFSTEWVNYEWNDRAYWNLTPADMYRSMRFLLNLERQSIRDQLVLEVGTGIGGIANYMAEQEGCELVGIDLGYAVDAARKHFGLNPFFHIVQASVFAPPFRNDTFDMAYSQGVIHHTFSTRTAFDRICRLPKVSGRLYVWVYSPGDEERTWVRRILMKMETLIRPVCSRLPENLQTAILLPILPLYLLHQNGLVAASQNSQIRYGWREALHAARDRFTPPFAHRHTEAEVCDWFRQAGYDHLRCVSDDQRPSYVPVSLVASTGVEGVRRHPAAAVIEGAFAEGARERRA